jgi:hypothetical protein
LIDEGGHTPGLSAGAGGNFTRPLVGPRRWAGVAVIDLAYAGSTT